MIKIVLVEPEIPPNTGNIARLCAAFKVELHLVEPLGFKLEDRYLKRAGCDYWPHVRLKVWSSWEHYYANGHEPKKDRLIMATTRANVSLPDFAFQPDDALLFGAETRGLAKEVLSLSPYWVKVPMYPMTGGGVRSLNLSTTVGIVLYTALAQCKLPPVYNMR